MRKLTIIVAMLSMVMVAPNVASAFTLIEQKLIVAILKALNSYGTQLPSGAIIMWKGQIENGHPVVNGLQQTDWWLCDGTNDTPDLRDRFVVGAGTNYNNGDTGGHDSATLSEDNLPAHQHLISGMTDDAGDHHHELPNTLLTNADCSTQYTKPFKRKLKRKQHFCTDLQLTFETNPKTTSSEKHAHRISFNSEPAGMSEPNPIDIIPKYYALSFIMYKPTVKCTREHSITVANMRTLMSALATFQTACGYYPDSLECLVDPYNSPYMPPLCTDYPESAPAFAGEEDLVDGWDEEIVYETQSDDIGVISYTLTSYGSDNEPGPDPPDPWNSGESCESDIIAESSGLFTQEPN